ncbi:hypothetical protein BDV96DRAFT_528100, partial [Lophiotrema nucula]
MALIKLSILLQMIRIFVPIPYTRSFYFIIGFAVINTLWSSAFCLVTVFRCVPVSKTWNSKLAGHCLDYSTWIIGAGVLNIVSDYIMLVLPMFWIARLQMDNKRKLTAGAIFVIGFLACAASVIRLVFIIKHLHDPDTLLVLDIAISTLGEIFAGIICANLPSLPAFIKHFKAR